MVVFNQDVLSEKMTELYEAVIEEYIEEHNTEEAYEESLNEIYGDVSVCGYDRPQGTLLKEIDPIAFSVGMSDNEDSVRERAQEEINENDFEEKALESLNMENED